MPVKDASRRIRDTAQGLKEDVRATVNSIGEILPRPLVDRKTLILRQSILKTVSERLKER